MCLGGCASVCVCLGVCEGVCARVHAYRCVRVDAVVCFQLVVYRRVRHHYNVNRKQEEIQRKLTASADVKFITACKN